MKGYSSSQQDAGCNPLECQMSVESRWFLCVHLLSILLKTKVCVIIPVHIFRIFWYALSCRLGSARSTPRSVCMDVRANSPHTLRLTCRTDWIYGNNPCKLYTFVGNSIYCQVITSRASSWKKFVKMSWMTVIQVRCKFSEDTVPHRHFSTTYFGGKHAFNYIYLVSFTSFALTTPKYDLTGDFQYEYFDW